MTDRSTGDEQQWSLATNWEIPTTSPCPGIAHVTNRPCSAPAAARRAWGGCWPAEEWMLASGGVDAGQRRSRTWSWVAPYQPHQAPYAGSTAPLTGAAASLTRNAITSAIAWGATACAIMSAGKWPG